MQDTLLIIFIGVVAIALLLQSLALVGIYRSVRRLSGRLDIVASDILKDLKFLSSKSNEVLATVKSVAEGIITTRQHVNETVMIIRNRVQQLDSFIAETTDIARLQVLRIQDAVDTASRRVEESFETLHNSILAPAREVNAIVRGIRVGLDMLLKRRKVPSGNIHQDEEMFI
jgi:hypothetical protein